jgi:hypothetical protein
MGNTRQHHRHCLGPFHQYGALLPSDEACDPAEYVSPPPQYVGYFGADEYRQIGITPSVSLRLSLSFRFHGGGFLRVGTSIHSRFSLPDPRFLFLFSAFTILLLEHVEVTEVALSTSRKYTGPRTKDIFEELCTEELHISYGSTGLFDA